MNITVEVATNAREARAASYVRQQVFGERCYRRLPPLDCYDSTDVLTLVARAADTNEPIAALSVIETTGDAALHNALDLPFPDSAPVGRYTQLAVLKPYRGLHIPACLISEAHRRFVTPRRLAYTWLLFDANIARASSFCTSLGFEASTKVFVTEYGRSRVLLRKENIGPQASPYGIHVAAMCVFPQALREDEWLAH